MGPRTDSGGEENGGCGTAHALLLDAGTGQFPCESRFIKHPKQRSRQHEKSLQRFGCTHPPTFTPKPLFAMLTFVKCKLHWQSNSEFLCVKVDRHTKSKKTSFTNLEIFHVREKSIPVEVIEVKDTVIAFAWEPKGERFATVMTADVINPERGPAGLRTNINFYMLEKGSKSAVINNFKLMRTRPQAPSPLRYFN
jgi:Eukaryotic translation initiation factor eIF2A